MIESGGTLPESWDPAPGRHPALRGALLAFALLFLAWEAYGAMRWVLDAGGLGPAAARFWRYLTSDAMLLLVVTDHLLLAGTVLVLLWLDAARRGWLVSRRLILAGAFVALGSPVILWYLASKIGVAAWPPRDGAGART